MKTTGEGTLIHCDIFIPYELLQEQHGLIFGYAMSFSGNHLYVSCVYVKPISHCGSQASDNTFLSQDSANSPLVSPVYLGILCKPKDEFCKCQMRLNIQPCVPDVRFKLCTDNNGTSSKIMHLELSGKNVSPKEHGTLIVYDRNKLLFSEFLRQQYPVTAERLRDLRVKKPNFIEFLLMTSYPLNNNCPIKSLRENNEKWSTTRQTCRKWIESAVNNRVTTFASSRIKTTATGKHLWRTAHKLKDITSSLATEKTISLRCGNVISAVLIDIVFGLLTMWLLLLYAPSTKQLIDSSLSYTNVLVNELQSIIHWLMGMPAGLKLIRALNSALGHFFLYHIYLWKTYIVVITPLFVFVLESFTLAGLLGVTCQLSLLSDLLSLSTIHVYCFYGYAARLYNFQVSCLCSLWRLFRGKKWNPLRNRVDSYAYDPEQLFIGTLTFTILLFLLPTVFVYYFVFTLLRLVILVIQGVIHKGISCISSFPAYVLLLHIIGSDKVNGGVQFIVLPKSVGESAKLKLKITQASREKIIANSRTMITNEEPPLSWAQLLHNLIWGVIIYPL